MDRTVEKGWGLNTRGRGCDYCFRPKCLKIINDTCIDCVVLWIRECCESKDGTDLEGRNKMGENVEVDWCRNYGNSQTSDAPPGGTGKAARRHPVHVFWVVVRDCSSVWGKFDVWFLVSQPLVNCEGIGYRDFTRLMSLFFYLISKLLRV